MLQDQYLQDLQNQLLAVLSQDQDIIIHRADDTGIYYSVYKLGSACIEPCDYQFIINAIQYNNTR